MRALIYISSITVALCIALPVYAQISNSSQPNPVQYTVTPEVPGPNQLVQIEVQGVGSFLGNATITWQKDGVVASSGIGDSSFSFTTGGLGSRTDIHLIINSSDVGTITNDFVISPSLVNLVWEADTTVPPFYRGKALYSGGSVVSVTAFPEVVSQGEFISSRALSFQWMLNNTLIPEQSGLGRATFTFQGDQLKTSEEVSVGVYTTGNAEVGYGDVVIPASTPQLVLYDLDPLRGEVFDAALPGALNLVGTELTVQAQPYYFSNISKNNGSLIYTWTLNGSDTTGPDANQGILTLAQSGSGSGSATLAVSAQNAESDQLVQAANASLQILFGQTSSGISLFGL